MQILTKLSGIFAAAALALLATPSLASTGGQAPAAVTSASALRAATDAVLSSGAVPGIPKGLDRDAVLQALQAYPTCGPTTIEDHAQALKDRFGERVPLAAMNLLVTDPTLTLPDLSQHLRTLRAWVRAGDLRGDRVAALVAALKDHAEAIVIGRTAEIAVGMAPEELADLRARAVDSLRRHLVDALTGNDSARAIREVRLALASDSSGVRASAARVALKQRGQPLRAAVVAMCERDVPSVQEIVCPEL